MASIFKSKPGTSSHPACFQPDFVMKVATLFPFFQRERSHHNEVSIYDTSRMTPLGNFTNICTTMEKGFSTTVANYGFREPNYDILRTTDLDQ
jgi:hypothetical protein